MRKYYIEYGILNNFIESALPCELTRSLRTRIDDRRVDRRESGISRNIGCDVIGGPGNIFACQRVGAGELNRLEKRWLRADLRSGGGKADLNHYLPRHCSVVASARSYVSRVPRKGASIAIERNFFGSGKIMIADKTHVGRQLRGNARSSDRIGRVGYREDNGIRCLDTCNRRHVARYAEGVGEVEAMGAHVQIARDRNFLLRRRMQIFRYARFSQSLACGIDRDDERRILEASQTLRRWNLE